MCLAVPGKIIQLKTTDGQEEAERVGTVDFQGTRLDVSLAFTPEADLGDWVLVHAGFAINTLTADDARQTWAYLKEADLVADVPAELQSPSADEP